MVGRTKAIVVGAGIGGLAAAIALRRAGLDAVVFERADQIAEVGAGISLWANALRSLEPLGVADRVRSLAPPQRRIELRSWNGALLAVTSTAQLPRHEATGLCVILHRAELLDALIEALGRQHLRLGAECTGFRQDVAGVEVRFKDGTAAQGDVLVGADGLNSVVRSQLHRPAKPAYAGYTVWRAVVDRDPAGLIPLESWGRGARFGAAPMSGNRVYWYATRNAAEGSRAPAGEKAEVLQAFRGWHAPVESLIEASEESAILRNDIYDRPVRRAWGEGRVTLLGDAAHPMTPNLGQGACQAIEDAVVLARCLRDGRDAVSALRAYESKRIPRANALVRRSRLVGRIGQVESALAVTARDALMKHVISRFQPRELEWMIGYEP